MSTHYEEAIRAIREANSRGDLAAALAVADSVDPEQCDSAELLALVATLETVRGNTEAAARAAARSRALAPDMAVAWAAESFLAAFQGDMVQAVASAQKALAYDDTDGWVLEACSATSVMSGEMDAALRLATRWMELHPDDEQAISFGASLLSYSDRQQEAEKVLAEADARLPGSPVIKWRRAHVLLKSGRLPESIQLLKEAATELPGNPELWGQLAQALVFARAYDEAEAAAQRALHISPCTTQALSAMANLCRQRGQLEEAAQWEKKAADAIPGLASQATLRKAAAAIRAADWKGCVRICDGVLNSGRTPARRTALEIKARALLQLGRTKQVEEVVAELEEGQWTSPTAFELRAAVQEQAGDLDGAQKTLRAGISEYRTAGDLRALLLRVLHRQGDQVAEAALIEDTFRNLPGIPHEFVALVTALDETGHAHEAREMRIRGLEVFPNTEELRLAEAVDRLEVGDIEGARRIAGQIKGDMSGVAKSVQRAGSVIERLEAMMAWLLKRRPGDKPPTLH